MTGKQYAEMFLREYAGGNVSDDVEMTLDDIYPAIDQALQDTLPRIKGELNGGWLKDYKCVEMVKDCVCGKTVYYTDVPIPVLQLPFDDGIATVTDNARASYSYVNINDLGNTLSLETTSTNPIYWIEQNPNDRKLSRIYSNKNNLIHYWILPITKHADVVAIPSDGLANEVNQLVRQKLGIVSDITDKTNDASQIKTPNSRN